MKSRMLKFLLIGLACVLVMNWAGCNSKDQYIGVYQAIDANGKPHKHNIVIELKENGKGVWKRMDEEVPFSWHIKNDELRINTKDGGTMVGYIKAKGIKVILPGEEELMFKKIM